MHMLNSVGCLAKADQLDAYARNCRTPAISADFTDMANSWRRNAVVALAQDE
jgi:hypothetical protein